MNVTLFLRSTARAVGPIRFRPPVDGHDRKRIVAMVDAGCSYDAICRELKVRSADIDCALREKHTDKPSYYLHP